MEITLVQMIWNTEKDRGSETYLFNDDDTAMGKYEDIISEIPYLQDEFVLKAFDINGEPNDGYDLEETLGSDDDEVIDKGIHWLLTNKKNNYFICIELKTLEVQ